MVRATVSYSVGRWFESNRRHQSLQEITGRTRRLSLIYLADLLHRFKVLKTICNSRQKNYVLDCLRTTPLECTCCSRAVASGHEEKSNAGLRTHETLFVSSTIPALMRATGLDPNRLVPRASVQAACVPALALINLYNNF